MDTLFAVVLVTERRFDRIGTGPDELRKLATMKAKARMREWVLKKGNELRRLGYGVPTPI
jgi:hypothetical protein